MKLKVDHPISQRPHVELTNCATAMPSYALPCCLKYCHCTSCLQMVPNNTLNWLRACSSPLTHQFHDIVIDGREALVSNLGSDPITETRLIDSVNFEVTTWGQGILHPVSSLLTSFRCGFTSSICNHVTAKNLKHAEREMSAWRIETTCQINGDLSCTVKRLQCWEA